MKKAVVILLVIFLSIFVLSNTKAGERKILGYSEVSEQLLSLATSILHGNDYNKLRENISPEAYVIYGSKYESLFEVLDNISKRNDFIEGKELKVDFMRLWLSNNNDEAYMVLKTENNSKIIWHSILFKLSKDTKWQVLSWHKS